MLDFRMVVRSSRFSQYAGEIIKLNNLKAGRAAEVVAVPEGTPAKKPEEKKSSTTPGSLDEEATPSEKVINKKVCSSLPVSVCTRTQATARPPLAPAPAIAVAAVSTPRAGKRKG